MNYDDDKLQLRRQTTTTSDDELRWWQTTTTTTNNNNNKKGKKILGILITFYFLIHLTTHENNIHLQTKHDEKKVRSDIQSYVVWKMNNVVY